MVRGVFVTGTDTGVGKTVVSAALFHRYAPTTPLRYWKPIQTGIEQDDDTAVVRQLAGCGERSVLSRGVRLRHAVSPHLAARLSRQEIGVQGLIELFRAEPDSTAWIVEGAGGVLVPITAAAMMVDLMRALTLPALIVARTSLGTINHTLLTIEALRHRNVVVRGVVMVGAQNDDNRRAIEQYGRVLVLGEMPPFDPLTADALAKWSTASLDPNGMIDELIR